jgi:hypothetical protein
MKNFRGQILGVLPARDAAGDERIDAVEIVLIKLSKLSRVALRRCDQLPLVRHILKDRQRFSARCRSD